MMTMMMSSSINSLPSLIMAKNTWHDSSTTYIKGAT